MATSSGVARSALRTYGAKGLVRRTAYELARRTGFVERQEQHAAAHLSSIDLRLPHIDAEPVRTWLAARSDDEREAVVRRAQMVLDGEQYLYGALLVSPGWPPQWTLDPITGASLPADRHWSRLVEHDPSRGDIKDVWELSRFGFVTDFCRAWAISGDDRWPEMFWVAIEDWLDHNPPFSGPNWMSGQESSLRATAWMLGAAVFEEQAATTADRRALLDRLLAMSAARVRTTIGYALSQRNNHAISEAVFLWSFAVSSADLHHRALRGVAARALAEAVADQFYPDGSYAQHSPLYHRLAVEALLFAEFAARRTDQQLPDVVTDALSRSAVFLRSLIDDQTGELPNLGSNDGSQLFRLAAGSVRDFRPLLQHLAAVTGAIHPLPAGPWDEQPRWFALTGGESPTLHPSATMHVTSGTNHILRGPTSHVLLRAGPLKHRPAHADQLNVDIWIAGRNVVRDPGTFRYSASGGWANRLAGEDVHNVPTIPGRPQAIRRGRFFWTSWHEAQVIRRAVLGDGTNRVVVAELRLDGTPAARLSRLVMRVGDLVTIVDTCDHLEARARWNLPAGVTVEFAETETQAADEVFRARILHGPGARDLHPVEDDPASGWESWSYGVRSPIIALVVPFRVNGWTAAEFGPVGENGWLVDHPEFVPLAISASRPGGEQAFNVLVSLLGDAL